MATSKILTSIVLLVAIFLSSCSGYEERKYIFQEPAKLSMSQEDKDNLWMNAMLGTWIGSSVAIGYSKGAKAGIATLVAIPLVAMAVGLLIGPMLEEL